MFYDNSGVAKAYSIIGTSDSNYLNACYMDNAGMQTALLVVVTDARLMR